MFLSLSRVLKLAGQQFHRNLWLSIATITLLALSLVTVNLIITLGSVAQSATEAVEAKIDVSVYFKPEVSNEVAEATRATLLDLDEVAEVEYIPREGALNKFKERHGDDPIIMESLEELGENPFGATLAIKATSTDKYPAILEFLDNPSYAELIEERNFEDHQFVIGKINKLMNNIRSFGVGVAIVFGIIAILVVINTVRVAVYTHRGEIRVMRLVGASSWFIRGPFLFEAIMFSFVATIFTGILVYVGLNFAQPYFGKLFGDVSFSLDAFYSFKAFFVFGAQFLGILVLTALSSFFAVRRYLKV